MKVSSEIEIDDGDCARVWALVDTVFGMERTDEDVERMRGFFKEELLHVADAAFRQGREFERKHGADDP